MSDLSKRSTVYFEADIHQALKLRAALTQESVSKFVNEAVSVALAEEQKDLRAFVQRENEETISYEELLEELKLQNYQ